MNATFSATRAQPSANPKAAAKAPVKKRRMTKKRRAAALLLARMEKNLSHRDE